MNREVTALFFALLQLISFVHSTDNATVVPDVDFPMPQGFRRVIVTHRKGTLKSGLSVLSRNPRIKQVMKMENLDLSVVIGSEADIQDIENSPDVERVEEDVKYYSLAESIPWGVSRTKSNFVWSKGHDGSNVKVCVIDSGVRLSHEDFDQSKISGKAGTDWYTDECSHGTHVAGTIAAKKYNGKGVAGVAPGANLHIIKVFYGISCNWVYASGLIGAMRDCADAGSKIISMSLGGASYSQSLSDVITEIWNGGILTIAAAGNDGDSGYFYPASYPNVVSVAATSSSSDNQIASFSQVNDQVDIAAPGVSVLSIGSGTDIQYTYKSGTSMATPHVSGVAALLWSAFPNAKNAQVKNAIEKTAIDLGAPGRDPYYGNGLIDANSAYEYLQQMLSSKPIEIVKLSMQNVINIPGRFRISWELSEPAESRICYYNLKLKNYSICTKRGESNLHVSILQGKPKVTYSFKIAAIDGSTILANFGPFKHTA